jgi:hypothetical protein
MYTFSSCRKTQNQGRRILTRLPVGGRRLAEPGKGRLKSVQQLPLMSMVEAVLEGRHIDGVWCPLGQVPVENLGGGGGCLHPAQRAPQPGPRAPPRPPPSRQRCRGDRVGPRGRVPKQPRPAAAASLPGGSTTSLQSRIK